VTDLLPTTRLSRTSRNTSCELKGEAVVLQVESGRYYGLNDVGARIWECLEKPVTPSEMVERLMQEFAVEAETCLHDVLHLLEDMRRVGLVEVGDGGAEEVPRAFSGGA
jgi:hypothetical protein